jgi:hypothetical protein
MAVQFEHLISELHQRFLDAAKGVAGIWLIAALIAIVLCQPKIRPLPSRVRETLRWSLLVITAVAAVAWAWSLLWASDDAYISFRYAENLAKEHGLVFNPGERVEGYTDFLWTIIAAVVIVFKGDPGKASIVINLASFVGIIFLVERLGRRLRAAPVLVGIATILVAANYTMASFATACIETMFAAMLVLLALERVEAGHSLAGGIAGIAATLTHPDHGIFYAALAAALFFEKSRRKELIVYLIPFFALFVPYFIWRWSYYGDLMPNTFYTKSADKVYFEQGIKYLLITIVGGGFWLSLPLGALGAFHTRKTLIGRYALFILPVYLTYVAKVGGDFMLGRFFVPAIPIWLLMVDAGYRWLMSRNHWRFAMCLLLPTTAIGLPIAAVKPWDIFEGVADERTFGGLSSFSSMEANAFGYMAGHKFYEQLTAHGHTPKVAIWCIGMGGYYAKLPIFDLRGLTSRSVAHLPIERRGRPGHEKVASPGIVVESNTDISEMAAYPAPYTPLTKVFVGGMPMHMVRYDPKVISGLPPGNGLMDFANYLDGQVPALSQKPAFVVACDLWQMREYYFSRNHDDTRGARLAHAAMLGDPTLAGLEPLLLETRDFSKLGYKPLRKFSFDASEAPWVPEGQAARWIINGLRPEQEYPLGAQGRFVNSFLPPDNEAPTGRLVSPEFQIQGDIVTFLIGGGQSPDTERLQLLVDNQPVRSATGCGTDWLGRRVWNVSQFKGQSARYVIEDNGSGGWGHVLVDEIVEWQAP